MKALVYYIFIVYIGLFSSDFIIAFLSSYIDGESFVFSKSIFYDPIKFSVVGGILYIINKLNIRNDEDN